MNWINALAPWQWIVMAIIPPLIVLLYFLKLRRVPVEVPSTYLWTKALEDMHVNSLWQRLRQNLLLALQLLMVALLILSGLRPGCQGTELPGERFIFVVDQSASMSAVDAGPDEKLSRLEFAKSEMTKIADQMKSADSAMVISFSDTSNVVQSYTTNKSLLKSKLRSIKQTQRASDINEALVAAAGLANPGRTSDRESSRDMQVAEALPARMYIFSDGGIAEVPEFFQGNLQPDYRPVGSLGAPHNVGIIALSVSDPLENDGLLQAFARVYNSDDEDHVVSVTLSVDGDVFDAQTGIDVPAGGATSLVFDVTPLLGDLTRPRQVKLTIDDDDVYAQDNTAWAVVNPPAACQRVGRHARQRLPPFCVCHQSGQRTGGGHVRVARVSGR